MGGAEGSAFAIPDTAVLALDAEGELVTSTVSDAQAVFRMLVPEGSRVYLVAGNEDDIPASFSGVAGYNPRLRIPNGQVRVLPKSVWEEEAQVWAGCPGLDDLGLVVGQVLVDGLFEEETGDPRRVTTAKVQVLANDGRTLPACYLDDNGIYQAGRTESGPTAKFLVPGVPEGVHTIQVTWRPIGQNFLTEQYVVHVPKAGVAPRFPLYVRFDP